MDLSTDITNTTNTSVNTTSSRVKDSSKNVDVIMTFRLILSSVGIVGNLNVLIVFLSHNKLRKKIPNIFIINQVSISYKSSFIYQSDFCWKRDTGDFTRFLE